MAQSSTDFWRTTRRVLIGLGCLLCLAIFLVWRIDNPRVERLRLAVIDRVVPPMEWVMRPVNSLSRMAQDFEGYTRVYQQNQELREELQRMKGFQEAAVQLEQQNARLRELNNVRLPPRMRYITGGEVLTDSGSPFRQSALVNIGRRDGVIEGAPAMDGLGLVGRVSGMADATARILFLTDTSSHVAAVIRPSGQRTIVSGDNTPFPTLDFIEKLEDVRPGDRVVTSGDGGILPPDLLIGQVAEAPDGRLRLRPAADYRRLRYIRVLRPQAREELRQSNELLGPRLPPLAQDAGGTEPMLSDTALWANRVLLVVVTLLLCLVALLPLGLMADARVMPDLIFATFFAWVIRQRITAPVLLIAILALMSDVLLMRPIGLWAFFTILATEYARIAGRGLRDQMFAIEWLIFAVIFFLSQVFFVVILNLTFTPAPTIGLVSEHVIVTILAYPVVVGFLHFVLRIRNRRPGQGARIGAG